MCCLRIDRIKPRYNYVGRQRVFRLCLKTHPAAAGRKCPVCFVVALMATAAGLRLTLRLISARDIINSRYADPFFWLKNAGFQVFKFSGFQVMRVRVSR
jgi:hypothetical protein